MDLRAIGTCSSATTRNRTHIQTSCSFCSLFTKLPSDVLHLQSLAMASFRSRRSCFGVQEHQAPRHPRKATPAAAPGCRQSFKSLCGRLSATTALQSCLLRSRLHTLESQRFQFHTHTQTINKKERKESALYAISGKCTVQLTLGDLLTC